MKKILTMLATAGALLTATVAYAEPTQNTNNYYYLGDDDSVVGLAAADVESNGTQREIWMLLFFKEAQNIDGKNVDGVWVLTDVNCSDNTFRFGRMEVMDLKGNADGTQVPSSDSTWSPIKADSPSGTLEKLVCNKDATGVRSLTADDTAALLVSLRKTDTAE